MLILWLFFGIPGALLCALAWAAALWLFARRTDGDPVVYAWTGFLLGPLTVLLLLSAWELGRRA